MSEFHGAAGQVHSLLVAHHIKQAVAAARWGWVFRGGVSKLWGDTSGSAEPTAPLTCTTHSLYPVLPAQQQEAVGPPLQLHPSHIRLRLYQAPGGLEIWVAQRPMGGGVGWGGVICRLGMDGSGRSRGSSGSSGSQQCNRPALQPSSQLHSQQAAHQRQAPRPSTLPQKTLSVQGILTCSASSSTGPR